MFGLPLVFMCHTLTPFDFKNQNIHRDCCMAEVGHIKATILKIPLKACSLFLHTKRRLRRKKNYCIVSYVFVAPKKKEEDSTRYYY